MDQKLSAASLKVDVCGDVYRGLARLCRGDSVRPRAVFVCLNDLGPAELEFFSIVSRSCCGTGVYVYGDDRSMSRVERAVEAGASGTATDEVIQAFAVVAAPATTVEPRVSESPEEGAGVTAAPQEPVADPYAGRPCVEGAASTDTSKELEASAQSSIDSATEAPSGTEEVEEPSPDTHRNRARVPWLRYANTPARKPPQVRQPPPEVRDPMGPGRRKPSSSEPLLTEAELRALIGDDIASIAPEAPDTADPTDHNDDVGDLP